MGHRIKFHWKLIESTFRLKLDVFHRVLVCTQLIHFKRIAFFSWRFCHVLPLFTSVFASLLLLLRYFLFTFHNFIHFSYYFQRFVCSHIFLPVFCRIFFRFFFLLIFHHIQFVDWKGCGKKSNVYTCERIEFTRFIKARIVVAGEKNGVWMIQAWLILLSLLLCFISFSSQRNLSKNEYTWHQKCTRRRRLVKCVHILWCLGERERKKAVRKA